ncbi:WG repeat-containing protein [Paenibacillus algorifonticola]|uniref:WG repeat-containing protein n=1 Tax=Paenibacillus algorifonticola TaxID=684063 RepID=UPI003D2C6022
MRLFRALLLFTIITSLITGTVSASSAGDTSSQKETKPAAEARNYLYLIKKDGKYGYINQSGKIVIEPVYDGGSRSFSLKPNEPVQVTDNKQKTNIYFSAEGTKLFECPQTRCVGIMQNERVIYTEKVEGADGKLQKRYGYLNAKGEKVTEPIFHKAREFSEGLAIVTVGKGSGYINTEGKLVIPYQFSSAANFSDDMAVVGYLKKSKEGVTIKYGFIDKTGKVVIPARFNYADSFTEGAARVSSGDTYGFINKSGEFLFEPNYTAVQPFSEGLAYVERNGKSFFVNKQGKRATMNVSSSGPFSNGLAPVQAGSSFGYINPQGAYVIKPTAAYSYAEPFRGELAVVELRENAKTKTPAMKAYINKTGAIVWNNIDDEKWQS